MHFNWNIDFGNIATVTGFIIALWQFNKSNKDRETKMHEDNIRVLTAINTKLDIMWSWFDRSQIGRQIDQSRNS